MRNGSGVLLGIVVSVIRRGDFKKGRVGGVGVL